MPKLYFAHTGSPGAPWRVPGQQPKGASRVDMPNTPAELAAWLNERRVPISLSIADPHKSAVQAYGFDPTEPVELELTTAYTGPLVPAGPAPATQCRSCASRDPASLERGAKALAAGANGQAIAVRIMELDGFELGMLAQAVAERFKQLAGGAA